MYQVLSFAKIRECLSIFSVRMHFAWSFSNFLILFRFYPSKYISISYLFTLTIDSVYLYFRLSSLSVLTSLDFVCFFSIMYLPPLCLLLSFAVCLSFPPTNFLQSVPYFFFCVSYPNVSNPNEAPRAEMSGRVFLFINE